MWLSAPGEPRVRPQAPGRREGRTWSTRPPERWATTLDAQAWAVEEPDRAGPDATAGTTAATTARAAAEPSTRCMTEDFDARRSPSCPRLPEPDDPSDTG